MLCEQNIPVGHSLSFNAFLNVCPTEHSSLTFAISGWFAECWANRTFILDLSCLYVLLTVVPNVSLDICFLSMLCWMMCQQNIPARHLANLLFWAHIRVLFFLYFYSIENFSCLLNLPRKSQTLATESNSVLAAVSKQALVAESKPVGCCVEVICRLKRYSMPKTIKPYCKVNNYYSNTDTYLFVVYLLYKV